MRVRGGGENGGRGGERPGEREMDAGGPNKKSV